MADFTFFDDFFLTKPLATADLRKKVDAVITKLTDMERDYNSRLNVYVEIEAKLTKMETKSEFVQEELEKAITAFEVPAPGKMEEIEAYLEENVYGPLSTAELVFTVPSIVIGIYAWRKMKPFADNMDKVVKFHEKMYRARFGKSAGKLGRAVGKAGFLARNPKAARVAKISKIGKGLGAVGLAILAVSAGIAIGNAKQMNDYYKSRKAEMDKQVAEANTAAAELETAITETNEAIAAMLEEADVTTVEDYVIALNEALADIGREAAHASTARRMLIDGMRPNMVARYVPGMKEAAVKTLDQRIRAERAILSGASEADALQASGLSAVRLSAVRRVLDIRGMLLSGLDATAVAKDAGYSHALVQGEQERLEDDLKLVWQDLFDLATAAKTAESLLVHEADVINLTKELQAKSALHEGATTTQVAGNFQLDEARVVDWAETLADDITDAREQLATKPPRPAIEVAIYSRLPLSLLT